MDIFIKTDEVGVITEYTSYNFDNFQKVTLPSQLLETNLVGWEFKNGVLIKPLQVLKDEKITALTNDSNEAKKITIQNGKTLVIAHDTLERDDFIKLIENVSNLSSTGGAFIYRQGKLGLRILPEIATYIFKDLFLATLSSGTTVPARSENTGILYEHALNEINEANTQAELDAVTWAFINPTGTVIDVNAKANKMLADPAVSDFAKAAINAAKDPTTGEIHLVKTLQELAADS